ncbi:MAG: hypothetical protein LBQ34_04630 [Alphaproteobacteria bacterium]|jgi:hypothetical protein|nr:hypothetical protein [Alphaproteobacteria bacterium]
MLLRFFIFFALLIFGLNAIAYTKQSSFFEELTTNNNTGVLAKLGRNQPQEYNTNPYQNGNKFQNSLIIGYSGQVANNDNEMNNFKITSNYSLAYLRKVSNKLSVGVEFGMFNQGRSVINDDTFAANQAINQTNYSNTSKLKPKTRFTSDRTYNICDTPNLNASDTVLCRSERNSLTTCEYVNRVFGRWSGGAIGCSNDNGFTSNSSICNFLTNHVNAHLYANLCNDGQLDEALFCNNFAKGSLNSNGICVFDNSTWIGPPPPTEACETHQSLCALPNITLPPAPECAINPSSDICNNSGGGGNNHPTSMTSNSYTAMFLANYELYRKNKIGLSLECGLGALYRDMKLSGAVSESDSATALHGKAGVVGSYFITNNLALGVGTHYVYIGETSFKTLNKTDTFAGYDFKMQQDRIMTYNLQLRYLF